MPKKVERPAPLYSSSGLGGRSPQAPPQSFFRRYRSGFFALGAVLALVFSATWNPPTGTVHSFTKASDYRPDREGGCVNSGKGCHGSETSYTSFNDYHPAAKCTDCHDYQGVGCIPCHSPANHECQVCHDGTMPQSPDRVRLTDPYPRGHYRETTHTAMGTPYDANVKTAPKGKARATCKSCHARDLMNAHAKVTPAAGSPYGTDLGCGECHNDVRSAGQAEVLSDWKKRRCEDCHRLGTSSPMHGTAVADKVAAKSPEGCDDTGTGCHSSSDLHALHPDRPVDCSGSAVKGEPGCHNLDIQAHVPQAKSCGIGKKSCHSTYDNDALSHKNDQDVHAPDGTAAAEDTSVSETACGDCHFMAPDGMSLAQEHDRSTSTRSAQGTCRGCHNDPASAIAIAKDWPGSDGPGACDVCHGHAGLDATHGDPDSSSHQATGSEGCALSGAGCHPTSDLSAVGAPDTGGLHRDCVRCHAKTASDGNIAYDPTAKSCGSARACHSATGAYDPASGVHDGATRTDGTDARHRATALGDASITDTATSITIACPACHQPALGTEHTRAGNALATGAGTSCTRCHNAQSETSKVVKASWPARTKANACSSCHDGTGTQAPHALIGESHGGRELADGGAPDSGACVTTGCHLTTDVRLLHRRLGCTVKGCHSDEGNIVGLDTLSCGGSDPETSCHVGYSASGGHANVAEAHAGIELDISGEPSPGYCARSGCHTSPNLKALHGTSCALAGCHEPGLKPRLKSCGGTDQAAACHTGFTATEHFVDHSADLTGTVNGITYSAGENIGCLGCHGDDLTLIHEPVSDAPITGGGSNCRVCHDDAEDPGNGAFADLPAVAGAVGSHDLRCVACHASGGDQPNATAAASAHKRISTEKTLPAGYVWSDPLEQWRTALDSPVGGGHNIAWSALDSTKRFPTTIYAAGADTYVWALPRNAGETAWLDATAVGASVDTTADIEHVTLGCDDCHTGVTAMSGPQGSAVRIAIDPAYSQTAYANPKWDLSSQFSATGTDRVVCMKCHSLSFGSVEGTTAPGGSWVHGKHAVHAEVPPTNPQHYGQKCVECHVRIPHAWRGARLLVRTIPEAGRPADTFPYILNGHDGLAGVRLRTIDEEHPLTAGDCATLGCHGSSDPDSHPLPSDLPTVKWWP